MAEDRQSEGRLGDEEIAVARLEGRAGRVRPALVVAGDDDPRAAVVEHDLRAAQHVAGGEEAHPDPVDRDGFAIVERLQRTSGQLAVTRLHDRDRAGCREHALVARPGVVAVPVRDDGARHREQRVDMEAAGLAIEPGRRCLDPGLGPRSGRRHRAKDGGCRHPRYRSRARRGERPASEKAQIRRLSASMSRIRTDALPRSIRPWRCQFCRILLTLSRLPPAMLPSSLCER